MEDENNTISYAKYNTFAIGNDTEEYVLKRLGKFTGPAGDSLTSHIGMKFTTKDCDNDLHEDLNCAVHSTGGWWYRNCHDRYVFLFQFTISFHIIFFNCLFETAILMENMVIITMVRA